MSGVKPVLNLTELEAIPEQEDLGLELRPYWIADLVRLIVLEERWVDASKEEIQFKAEALARLAACLRKNGERAGVRVLMPTSPAFLLPELASQLRGYGFIPVVPRRSVSEVEMAPDDNGVIRTLITRKLVGFVECAW
jgi:acyl-CoA synthetase (AMP-forming)/AMP-acid ligase II